MDDGEQRLELTWAGKETRPTFGGCLLVETGGGGHAAAGEERGAGRLDNRLIHGDNLAALTALEPEFAGRVKCVYVDPPYNTGSSFAQFEDGRGHAQWLGMMRDVTEDFEARKRLRRELDDCRRASALDDGRRQ